MYDNTVAQKIAQQYRQKPLTDFANFNPRTDPHVLNLVTIPEASKWASELLKKAVFPTNISYLVQYGKVKKHGENGSTIVDLNDLKKYYDSYNGKREVSWKKNLGNDLNWTLSFDNLREKDTTKHIHRLHPYKGKYIPQLVEYFIDSSKNVKIKLCVM